MHRLKTKIKIWPGRPPHSPRGNTAEKVIFPRKKKITHSSRFVMTRDGGSRNGRSASAGSSSAARGSTISFGSLLPALAGQQRARPAAAGDGDRATRTINKRCASCCQLRLRTLHKSCNRTINSCLQLHVLPTTASKQRPTEYLCAVQRNFIASCQHNATNSWNIVDEVGDGACLLRTIARRALGDPSLHAQVRQQIVSHSLYTPTKPFFSTTCKIRSALNTFGF